MWLLGRLIPYMFAEDVPESDQYWRNYLQMLEILDLLMAPEITVDEVRYLGVIINAYLTAFVELYTSSSIIPKHHFMIHMARLSLK